MFAGTPRGGISRALYVRAFRPMLAITSECDTAPERPQCCRETILVEIARQSVDVNGRRFSCLAAGDSGPLVLFCHGFPELALSWRHQLPAVAAAGFRVLAPDMRGYGETGGPQEIDAYTIFDLIGDAVGLVKAEGASQAIIVGHDWGAAVAWHAALLRPDIFTAVCAMSVPYQPRRPGKKPIETYRKIAEEKKLGEFYIVAFQDVGRGEMDFEEDVDRTMRAMFGGIGDRGVESDRFSIFGPPGRRLLEKHTRRPLPAWLDADTFAAFVDAFKREGFRRPLNWYRNIDRNFDLMAPFQDLRIAQPALFITGETDPVRLFAGAAEQALAGHLPNLRGVHVIEGAGHWVQQEVPDKVNTALLGFLRSL
jgi:pimeloyl-ACP methyl ester carboxylesterase